MRNISLKYKVKLCIIMQLMVREIKKSTQTGSENLSKEIAEKDTHTSHISFGYLRLPCRSLCSLLKTLSASQGDGTGGGCLFAVHPHTNTAYFLSDFQAQILTSRAIRIEKQVTGALESTIFPFPHMSCFV